MKKRDFLRTMTYSALSTPLAWLSLPASAQQLLNSSPEVTANDDRFWQEIRGAYRLKPDYINLENGYYNILPTPLLERHIEHIREVNYQGSYYMRKFQFENKRKMAARVAELVGTTPDQLVLTRNTTESLDMIIGGYPWQPGDEAVMAEQDYGAMLDMFRQAAKRFGIKNNIVSVPNHPASDEEIVELYAKAITPKTKLLMICHMINISGQILPVRKICDMAHSKGVEVMVDGAHAIAHIPVNMTELDCDYYGASLHKWLCVPLGVGLLYVKKKNIGKIWPLLAPAEKAADDITRLNHLGTHPVHCELTVIDSIEFFRMIGAERKEARLRFLQQYWTSRVAGLPGIVLNTPTDAARSCAIANVGIKGMKPADMAVQLLEQHKIWTVAIDTAGIHGCRITPNLYTTTAELDVFIGALKEMSSAAS
jgi:selenocysteine lyase/cysteine desulfurase